MRRVISPLVLVAALALLSPVTTTAQALSTFEDFSSAEMDDGRWSGYAYTVGFADLVGLAGGWNNRVENPATRHPRFSTVNATSFRRINNGQLQLRLDSAGGMHPDPNVAPGHGRLGVSSMAASQNVVQAKVTPVVAAAPGCRATGESRVRAQLVADVLVLDQSYVDEGTVFATLALDRSSFGGDRIYAVVSRCRDYSCAVAEDIEWVIFNRAWTLGGAHTLTIRYQPANSRVVFTVGGGGVAAETRTLTSPQPRSDRTYIPGGFGLRVETTPANCPAAGTAPAQRIGVTMDARFDNVRVGAP